MDENEVYGDMGDIEEQEILIETPLVIIGNNYSKIIENATINEMKRLENRLKEHKGCRVKLG